MLSNNVSGVIYGLVSLKYKITVMYIQDMWSRSCKHRTQSLLLKIQISKNVLSENKYTTYEKIGTIASKVKITIDIL